MNVKGFILAAGFSTRLRPITQYIPKPLLPIAGETLLDLILQSLKDAGINDIGINLHYKAEEIENYIKEKKLPIKLFHEKDILDTGGALYNAKDFLKDSIFIVHNSDIYWDGNIKDAITCHLDSKNTITLLIHDYPKDNKLFIDENGNLICISDNCKLNHTLKQNDITSKKAFKKVAFCGVAIYNPQLLELIPEGASSVIDLWLKTLNNGLKVGTFQTRYSFWFDVGTPLNYASAVFHKLKRQSTSIYVHPSAQGCDLIDTQGNIVLERDVKILKPLKGKNLIFLPEVEFSSNVYITNAIIGKNFQIPVNSQHETEELTLSGSDRKYTRKNNKIFCQYSSLSEDFEKTVFLGKFLKEKNFPVPAIIDVDKNRKMIVFEDLGDLTLYSWLQCKRNPAKLKKFYKKVVEHIAFLHWKIFDNSTIKLPEFDYSYFRWESNYFLEECVKAVFNIQPPNLQNDLHLIAEILSQAKKVILHRDLQSQNIMLKDDEIYFVDYQGARWGPPGYDIASLMWDPYVELNNEIRHEVINSYIEKNEIEPYGFIKELSLCRIQRHMQALGAYGFLSLKKGKRNFLKFIPTAMDLLVQDIEECYIELNELKKLVLELKNLSNNGFC